MNKRFGEIIKRDGKWYVGYCPEVRGANGQGRTREECRVSLFEAMKLILECRNQASDNHKLDA